ncbi:MAG: transglutaminase domain-containing protein [Promethearchaeati archaeon]
MSGLDEGLLGPTITKKRVIALALVTIIMIAAFAYSVMIYSWLFGSPRKSPNERLEGAPEEDALLILPESGYNWSELAENLDLDDPDLLDQLRDLHDGNIDLLDLLQYAELAAALAGSDIEVFRVYNIPSYEEVSEKLWKFECFDEFLGDSWECNVPLQNYDFYSYSDYYSKHSGLNIYNISMPLSPGLGSNSFMIPNLFPNPYIMENSIKVPNITPGSEVLRKNAFNSTTLTLDFTSENSVNMTYELFGLTLPTNTEINNSALDEDYTPAIIRDRYLQLPPDISTYLDFNVHPNINFHYNNLRTIINDEDTSFVVANKIRNYLQENFSFGYNALENSPPADGEDLVEWFCFHEEGIWTHFASAFCVFCRAFGVSCRFVDGYNSRYADTVNDPIMGDGIAVKYRNLYNWAEVYIPTDVSGNGIWVQMDMLYDSFGGGSGVGPILNNYNITLSSNFTSGPRGSIAQLNATLSSSYNLSVSDKNIQFYDYTMDEILGFSTTDSNGLATFTFPIDDNQTVGPHIIYASYGGAANLTFYIVDGDIQVNLTSVSPPQVNISQDPYTTISGTVRDPVNGKPVKNAIMNLILYQKGTNNIVNPSFSPSSITANDNGVFSQTVNIDSSVPYGQYEVRVDFNGSWANPLSPSFPFTYPFINNYSNRLDLNVTKELTYSLWFYINDIPATDNSNPLVSRFSTIELKAIVYNGTGDLAKNEIIGFYDGSGTLIGQNVSDENGVAIYNYNVGINVPAGPNQIISRIGTISNSSYYILNAPINIYPIDCPNPNSVSRSSLDDEDFTIQGYLEDDYSNPIRSAIIYINLYDQSDSDVTSQYLEYVSGSFITDNNGNFSLQFGVDNITPLNNYTLNVSFYGQFNNPSVSFVSSQTQESPYELEVIDPYQIDIYFTIDGTPTKLFYNDGNPPKRYNLGENINFGVEIYQGGSPVDNDTVYFYDYDVSNDIPFHTYEFNGFETPLGYYNFSVNTGSWNAGLHEIRVTYGNYGVYNFTYVLINKSISINTNLDSPSDYTIQRLSESLTISGNVYDFDSLDHLRGLGIGLYLFDINGQDYSDDLNFASGYSQNMTLDQDGTFQFVINSVNEIPIGEYNLRVDFNGTVIESAIYLSDYLVHSSSSPININITAGVQIDGNYDTVYDKDQFYYNDTMYVYGYLNWDNLTVMNNYEVNITILDALDNILETKIATTDPSGFFNTSFTVKNWDEDTTKVIVNFLPEDNFDFPDYYYVEAKSQQVFREI